MQLAFLTVVRHADYCHEVSLRGGERYVSLTRRATRRIYGDGG